MLDKIILLLLILTLPVGVVIAQRYGRSLNSGEVQEETIKKVDALISQINQNPQSAQQATQPEFSVTAVQMASESGTIKVSGIAPKTNAQVMVSAIITPLEAPAKAKTTKSASESAEVSSEDVLGQSIETKAITVANDGAFVIAYPIEEPEKAKKIELHLEQGRVSTSIIYDVEKKTFEQV